MIPKTIWGSMAALALLGLSAAHAEVDGETPLGSCTDEMVRGLFQGPPDRTQIRAFITRLNGEDPEAKRFGMQVGRSLRDALTTYAEKSLAFEQSGLSSRNVRIKFLPCAISDHDHARTIGQSAGADVVLWGQTFCDWRKPKQCQTVDLRGAIINSYNQQNGSPNARMQNRVEILQPKGEEPEASFKTSLTVVNWVGLEANPDGAFTVQRARQLADADLPKLASARPRMLLDFVLGLYAFRAQRHGLAAEFFHRSQESVAAGLEGLHDLYRMMGTSYMTAGDPERGMQALTQALAVCQQADDRCRGIGLHNLGKAENQLGRKQAALGHYRQSLELSRKRSDREGEAATLNNIGGVYYTLGETQKALEFYNQALPLRRQVGDREGEAITLTNIGGVYSALGETQKALEFYNQALPLRRQVGDREGEASTLNSIGRVYSDLGETQKALEFYNQALPLRRQVGDRGGEAVTLNNIGRVYDALGETQKALEFYNQALPLHRQVGDRGVEAVTLNNIGRVYDALGEKPKALEFYNQALPLHRQVGDRRGEAVTLNNIGGLYSDLGETQKALEFYNQALPLLRQVGDTQSMGITLDNMASALDTLGRTLEALARYQDAAAMYRLRNPPDLDKAKGSLRHAFQLAQRYRMGTRALALLQTLGTLGRSQVEQTLLRAQYLGRIGIHEAPVAYQTLSDLGMSLPAEGHAKIQTVARAGLLRSQHQVRWPECPGLVVLEVVADSQAAQLGLAVGDIILRYQGNCVHTRADLSEFTSKNGAAKVTLELWRGNAPIQITAAGGKLGIVVESF